MADPKIEIERVFVALAYYSRVALFASGEGVESALDDACSDMVNNTTDKDGESIGDGLDLLPVEIKIDGIDDMTDTVFVVWEGHPYRKSFRGTWRVPTAAEMAAVAAGQSPWVSAWDEESDGEEGDDDEGPPP